MSRNKNQGGVGFDPPVWSIVLGYIIWFPVGVILTVFKLVNMSEKKRNDRQDGYNNRWDNAPFVNPKSSFRNENTQSGAQNTQDTYNNVGGGFSYAADGENGYRWNGTTYSYSGAGSGAQSGGGQPPKRKRPPVGSNLHFKKNAITTASAAGSALFGFLTIYNLLMAAVFGSGIPGAVVFGLLTIASAVTYLFSNRRDYRIMGYIAMMNGVDFIKISKLSEDAGVSYDKTIKDLYYMRSKGMLPGNAILDKKIGYLILTPEARDEAEAEYQSLGGYDNAAEDFKSAEASDDISDNEKTLRRIRELNAEIKDPEVSAKIDEIESITRKIFEVVDAKPSLKPQVSKFLDYYLPTTLKLLGSYSYFENLGVRGKNIDEGMKNIEDTLDMTVKGFRKMLDSLFEAEVVDVSADISVLENMMKMDGYTQNADFDFSSEKGSMEGGAAAAKKSE
ncbi:MAG: 5-bromo-4-chloroindolyl phosphate hydrolysis family protein [Firmicutes bacterium]|nr:5-bromo-4-chloroindolyl phosphate hydrolysis family protein [Bacillota bacterium]